MRDRLNRLEKLGFLLVDDWLRWREMRNRLAHEYTDHPAVRFAAIQAAIAGARQMADVYRAWRSKLPIDSLRNTGAGPRGTPR
jgi:hypothetical protein